jgi:3-deoxy-D-manno-octulosonic-acid transferase
MSELWARMALGAYRALGAASYPFLGPFLALRARRGKEERDRRHERYGYPSISRPKGPLVWLHAASIGESLAILPLVERVSALGIQSVLTTGTVTSAGIVQERLPPRTAHQYVPLDMRRAVQRFIGHWRPDLAIFAESEVWPMIVLELEARRVPQILVNARMSDRSYDRWLQMPRIAEALFEKIAHVAAQSETDAERFRDLGARPVTTSGNLKVDVADLPYDKAEFDRFSTAIGKRPAWIAASTHAGEEAVAVSVHKRLLAEFPDLLTIIAPRHPERAGEVASIVAAAGIEFVRRSSGETPSVKSGILLADTIGEMGLLFRLAQVAFVGRSLTASGGQNPLEPAALGAAVLSGRNVENFRDAYRNLLAAGGARLMRDEDMLAANVAWLLANPVERRKMADAARKTVEGMRGALDRTMASLDPYLFPLTVVRGLDGGDGGR